MKVYIYTIPKAGTYFLADFIARLGFRNTGYHVSQGEFLNTLKGDRDTNVKFPGRVSEKQFFMKTLRGMNDGELAFGHFPAPIMSLLLPDFSFVCSYRHPRTTLVAEFVDFRFRREGVKWIRPDQIKDDRQAFCAFLERQGPAHMVVFSQMIGVTLLANEPLFKELTADRTHILSFDALLSDPAASRALVAALGGNPDMAAQILADTKNADTKTKATNLDLDRDAFWTDQAEDLYHKLGGDAYVARGRELGWTM